MLLVIAGKLLVLLLSCRR